MAGRLALFDIDAITAVVLGVPIEDGRSVDGFITISPQAQFEWVESAEGLVIRFKTRKRRTPVKLSLLYSSAENVKLSAIHAGDVASTGGAGVGPFLVQDANGSTLYTGTCSIDKAPEVAFGAAPKDVVWELSLIADPETMLLGGTDSPE